MFLPSCRRSLNATTESWSAPFLSRGVSSSPYGRTHVWRRRPLKLPNPVVPHFPQRVVLADGSTFVHWTTSPRSHIKLTRDTTNNPIWSPWLASSNPEDVEGASAGRLGRFRRKFEELGGTSLQNEWLESFGGKETAKATKPAPAPSKAAAPVKKKK